MSGYDPNNTQANMMYSAHAFENGGVYDNSQANKDLKQNSNLSGTLSQNVSLMPGFDHTNNTQGANIIQHQKVFPEPKVPKEKDPNLFHCEICSSSYKYQQNLKNHVTVKHKEIDKMPKDPKLFNCEICSFSYKY